MLHRWFTNSVAKSPEEPALILGEQITSYRVLDALSRRISPALQGIGVRARVGLPVAPSVFVYAAYLAILRTGGVVVPLNLDQPRDRLTRLVLRAGLDGVLVDGDAPAVVHELGVPVVRAVDTGTSGGGKLPDDKADWTGAAEDPAYLLFTSGSTGEPKGVPISHGNIDAFVAYNVQRYAPGHGSRFSHVCPLTFDMSLFDLFVAWGSGAAVVVPLPADLYDPVQYVREHTITHWFSVPSMIAMTMSAGQLSPGSMPSLKWSLFAGDRLTYPQAAAWLDATPNGRLDNLYGPTETTVAMTCYRLPIRHAEWPVTSNGTVPLGASYPHMECVIDPATGELLVRGPQRFAGYLTDAGNDGVFVDAGGAAAKPRPKMFYRTGDKVAVEGGLMVHLGRLDSQVKIRGFRVEPNEVESALLRCPGVHSAHVGTLARPDGTVDLAAVCAGNDLEGTALRQALRDLLPVYMLPGVIRVVERLPMNDRGKVDRNKCARLLADGAAF